MKKIKYILSAAILSIVLVGCDAEQAKQDVSGIIDESAKPNVTYTVSTTAGSEFEATQITIDINMDKPINNSTTFSVNQVGGTAVLHEDYEATTSTIPAYATSGQIVISITSDLDQTEGNETLDIEVGAFAVPDTYEVLGMDSASISIEDYQFCLWTLDTVDAYGDGWQGGHLLVTIDGVDTMYAAEDGGTSYDIPVISGASYAISYVSGTTGTAPNAAGSPGWEEENSYVLTDPDGVVYADGPVPTVGAIASGTCN